MTSNGTSRIGPANRRPQNVTEVLCNELGAAHPDGALRQIRTMKRVLRKHYEAQKRLERFGVDTAMDAADTMADLRARLQVEREQWRERARANVQTIDAALDALDTARERLRTLARPAEEIESDSAESDRASSGTRDSADAPLPSPGDAFGPPTDAVSDRSADSLNVFDAVTKELDELRLELWLEAGQPDDADSGVDALLDRLYDRVQALSEENEALRDEISRLRASITA